MRTFYLVILLVVLAGLCAGCEVVADPLGATTRTDLRARAAIEVARIEAEAERGVAMQETVRTGIVAAMVPWALLIVMGGVIVAIIVNWQGRIWLVRTQAMLGQMPAGRPRLPRRAPGMERLQRLAEQQGYEIVIDDDWALLVDEAGETVGRRLLGSE